MASVYEFDTTSTIKDAKYPKSTEAIAAVEKALAGKKIPKAHIDKFVNQLKGYNCNAIVLAAQQYIEKNMVAKKLAPVTKDPNVLQKAFLVAMYGPQKKVLQAGFDLSVHLKDGNLQLQHTDCKGSKKILLTVAP